MYGMDIFVRNRHDVSTRCLPAKGIIISITDRKMDHPIIADEINCLSSLKLNFDDVEADGLGSFNADLAKQIWDFVLSWMDKTNNIIVHCEAGISRSPAIAIALARFFKEVDHIYFSEPFFPNRRVIKIMMETMPKGQKC